MGTVDNMDRNNKDNEKGTPMAKNTKVDTQVGNVSVSTEGSILSPMADGNVPSSISEHTDMGNQNTQPITDASIGGDILSGMTTGNGPPTTESSSVESHDEIENDWIADITEEFENNCMLCAHELAHNCMSEITHEIGHNCMSDITHDDYEQLVDNSIPNDDEKLVNNCIPNNDEKLVNNCIPNNDEKLVNNCIPYNDEKLVNCIPNNDEKLVNNCIPNNDEKLVNNCIPNEDDELMNNYIPVINSEVRNKCIPQRTQRTDTVLNKVHTGVPGGTSCEVRIVDWLSSVFGLPTRRVIIGYVTLLVFLCGVLMLCVCFGDNPCVTCFLMLASVSLGWLSAISHLRWEPINTLFCKVKRTLSVVVCGVGIMYSICFVVFHSFWSTPSDGHQFKPANITPSTGLPLHSQHHTTNIKNAQAIYFEEGIPE
jgi:hypothetical protein